MEKERGLDLGIIFCGSGKIGEVSLNAVQRVFAEIHIFYSEEINKFKRDTDKIITDFKDSDYEVVLLAGWTDLIGEELLNKKRFINIHGSLLPKYRGLHSIFWMIMNGEKELGYTIHEVNKNIDDGPILYQYKFEYRSEEISQVLNNFYEDIDTNLTSIISKYMNKVIVLKSQNKSEATWVPRRNLKDCELDFDMPYYLMKRLFLALTSPYPLPRILLKGVIYEITESSLLERDYYCEIGRVVNIDEEGVWITIKEGFLIINSIKNTEKNVVLDARDIFKLGQRLSKEM